MSEEGNDVDLSPEERAEVDGMFLKLANADHYEILGVARDADRKTIRDAYFALSQRFHPDAWFGRRTGAWKARMESIFRDVTKSYDVLSNRNHRAAYDASIGIRPNATPAAAPTPATPSPSVTHAPQHAAPPAPTNAPQPRPSAPAMSAVAPPSAPLMRGTSVNDPIIPDRSARASSPRGPAPGAATVAAPQVDHEAARRAAREALARKMGVGSAGATGRFPTMPRTGEHAAAPAPGPTRSISGTTISSSTMASLQNARSARLDAERTAKLEHFLRLADESVQRKDVLGESNALQLALAVLPDDEALRLRAAEAGRRSAEVQADKYAELARQAESQQRWETAADHWQRVVTGRPRDVSSLLRAAMATLRAGKDPHRAADFAKRAVQIAPRVDAYTLLAEIYLSARMKASALAAIESAAKLDPNSPVVKDLLARARA